MGDSPRNSCTSECRSPVADQIKVIMEENVGLKSYIDNMNKECLELNAALFEEANKMVTTARAKQQIAEKKLKEKNQENEMLRSQVLSLREIISKLPSPIETNNAPGWDSPNRKKHSPRKFNSASRSHRSRSTQLQSTPALFRKSCENLSLMSSDSGGLLTAVSRSVLLNALLAEEFDADETDRLTFQAFCDWIRSGCPLNVTLAEDSEYSEHALVSSKSEPSDELNFVVRSKASQLTEDEEDEVEESDHEQVTSTQRTSSTSPKNCPPAFDLFMHYLLEFDVKPCLLFRDRKIREAIYRALPDQMLEMIPITRFTELPPTKTRDLGKYCPLLPPLEPAYQLTIENVSYFNEGKVENKNLVVNVSSEARNRIASVISLFQYLKMIARECQKIVSANFKSSEKHKCDPLLHLDHTVMTKQFAKIQRLRLGIAFARLGFGIPEIE